MAQLIVDATNGVVSRLFKTGQLKQNVGNLCSGYKTITINKKSILVHRLIYESVHGAIGEDLVVDHINGNKTDNRIENLRAVSQAKNCQNRHAVRKDSKSGLIGVESYGVNGKYVARMCRNYKKYYIGSFDNKDDARFAYEIASMFFHN